MGDEKTIGSRALETIAELWDATGPRLRRGENGFSWWPGDFCVEVTARKRLDGYVPETWFLVVRTDFLKDIPVDDPKFIQLAAAAAPFYAPTFAWVYPVAEIWAQHGEAGTRPRLWLSNTAYINADNVDWLTPFVGMMSLMQPINAQVYHDKMPTILGGGVPDKSRLKELVGLDLDAAIFVAGREIVPAGRDASRWIGTGEFQTIVEQMEATGDCYGTANDGGLTMETSFGEDAAQILLQTEHPHPALGTGLVASLLLPVSGLPRGIAEACARMNLMESMWTDDFPQLGCWHPRPLGDGLEGPTFTMFVPNMLYQRGIAHVVAAWMVRRARWARQRCYRKPTDKPLH